MKTCTRCKATKPPAAFYADRTQTSGRASRCKQCASEAQAVRRGGRTFVADTGPVAAASAPRPEPPPWTPEAGIAERRERVEAAGLKTKLAEALRALEQCRYELATAIGANDARREVEPIRPRERGGVLREATAVALASDWHIESSVTAAQVNGVNEYNLEIARRRCERYFSGLRYMYAYHGDHFLIRDMILWLGGDLITGYLHPDNIETNELSPVQAIATLHEWLADGIRSLLAGTEIERLQIVCSSGNHGRLTDKMRAASREANSIEWLLYKMLEREFADEPRIEFVIPAGSQTYVQVYDKTIRFLHGDDAKFGGGVGGITIPIYKALARWQTVRRADLTVLGHFHSQHMLPDLVINGSLIGYDAYAMSIGARYEEPQQAFFLMDSRRGMSMPSSIWVKDHDEIAKAS